MSNEKQLHLWWGEQVHKVLQKGFLSEAESREWLGLARLGMKSGVTKEQFIAFLETEARKKEKTIPLLTRMKKR